jgi:hypothetical protein
MFVVWPETNPGAYIGLEGPLPMTTHFFIAHLVIGVWLLLGLIRTVRFLFFPRATDL